MRSVQRSKYVDASENRSLDRTLLITTLVLVAIGLVAVADASAPQALKFFKDEYYFIKQQVAWAALGVTALFVVSFIRYTLWEKLATPIFFIGILLLLIVLVPGVGISALGARRWIDLQFFSFQPAEVVKFAVAVFLAKLASRDKKPISYFVTVALVAGLVMIQPDLGTTLIISGIAFVQIFVSGISLVYFAGGAVAGIISVAVLILTSSYRRDRLLTFLGMTQSPLDNDYHIKQILLALGSGGFFGVGLGQSRQKYLFLPESATDSIFAVIAEELGFVGGVLLISVFVLFIYRGIKIAEAAPDKFSQMLAIGITAWIGVQVFLNIGSMVAFVPLTGIPLPFISYGGTALTTLLFATGILLNISRYAKKDRERKTT